MAGGVAHDLNNLLNIVMSFGQFVREAVEDTAGAQLTQTQAQAILSDVDQIHRATQRAAHLSHQLLTFGGRDTVERAVVDVNVLIGEVLAMISGTIGEHAAITSRLDPHLRHVLASSSQISQVLLNLAVNARDAMPDGGSLHFETANTSGEPGGQAAGLPARDWVRISVTDTGHGMPPATVLQAMEPFFTTKPLGQGTGLGLATSYGIIKQAGGELVIDSLPGRGTTVHLYLPASYQPVDTGGQAAPAAASAGQTILVAEDEDGLRDLITRMLAGAGYRVLAASNGREALAMAERHDDVIHALLTDVVMPAMSGGEVARELRQTRPDVCVLYVSGYAAPVMTEQGLLDPGVAIVNKPFTRDELLGTLEATLSRQRPRERLLGGPGRRAGHRRAGHRRGACAAAGLRPGSPSRAKVKDTMARNTQPVSKLVRGTRWPKMMGMKKPPTAASVSIRPPAVPRYWCSMRQTRAGTASQAAKPKIRKKPIPIPRTQSAGVGSTGMRASSAATATSGPTTNMRRFLLRSAQYPPSRLPGMPARPMSAASRPPADGSRCRADGHVLAEQLRAGEVRAVAAEQRDTVDPQIPAAEHDAQGGTVEAGADEGPVAVRDPENREGDQHDEQLEDTGQDQRHVPARRALHVEPDIEREGGPRAEDGAPGDAERERDVAVAEPDDDGRGPDRDEH